MQQSKMITNLATKLFVLTFLSLSLIACNGLFEKDNVPLPKPLVTFRQSLTPTLLWSNGVGGNIGIDYIKLSPALSLHAIFASGTNGRVAAFNKLNGRLIWQTETQTPITTGPAVGDGIVVVASRRGDIIALNETTGHIIWRTNIPAEIIATPAIGEHTVIIKSIDGFIHAFSIQNGQKKWVFQQAEPDLILRGGSTPVIYNHYLLVGFANGSLAKLNLENGRLEWLETIAMPEGAFAIQRMVDIDASPIIYKHQIYAATYQGKIASLNWNTGRIQWARDISSYTGMAANNDTIYISDAKSHLLALNTATGAEEWQQIRLEARGITAPAVMGQYIVVGDAEGYLHWINKTDGRFAARVNVGAGIHAAPIVENNILYALTSNGTLIAYTLK